MNSLPDEIILEIWKNIPKITDKRQFLKTCSHYNKLTKKSMDNSEFDYNNLPHFGREVPYTIQSHTIGLCHDGYFNLIPEHYMTDINYNLIPCLSYYNCLPLLKLARKKGCDLSDGIMYGSLGGHINIIKWLIKINQDIDMLLYYAEDGGHRHLLKWLKENKYVCDYEKTRYLRNFEDFF